MSDQIREFVLPGKTKIKCQFPDNYFPQQLSFTENLGSWIEINESNKTRLLKLGRKELVIYSYSISNNFVKEAFSKIGIKFRITNLIREASIIIGLKKSLKQNFKLKELAKDKQIPIYSLNKLSLYQLFKLLKTI